MEQSWFIIAQIISILMKHRTANSRGDRGVCSRDSTVITTISEITLTDACSDALRRMNRISQSKSKSICAV